MLSRDDSRKIAAELVKASLTAGWLKDEKLGAEHGEEIAKSIVAIADGLFAYANK